jgi:iron complex transport system substrate-binding protein
MFKSDNYHIVIMTSKFLYLILICGLFACNKKAKTEVITLKENQKKELKYAEGFSITKKHNYSIIEINQPWPYAEKGYKYVVISKANAAKTNFKKDAFDGIITTPINKIVVTSTTHLPALELLQVEETLVGFPGTHYISSETIRTRIDNNQVRELGKNEGINTEILLELQPDVVVGFGIDGGNRSLEIIKKSGIPVIFNGDWVEHSPLAKAEWIKFFGTLYNKERQADSIFTQIEKDYLATKQLALKAKTKPSVLSGAMHNDIWYLPSGNSTEAQLLKDANANYLWKNTKGKGSLQLNFESVFVKAKDADIWLNPSNYSSLEALKNGNENHAMFRAFQNKNVYSITNTTGKSGGVLYYELGMARPDLVLKDIIKICHPELLENYEPYFFKPLK